MFGAIISPVQVSTCPVVSKLTLGFSASDPVEVAVHCLQFSWNNSIIHHTCSGGFVCLEGVAISFLVKFASSPPFLAL